MKRVILRFWWLLPILSAIKERKLLEKIYRVEGWQR